MKLLLNHTKTGQGPALVILHGLFGSSSNWRNITRALADAFTVYTVDARNHGDSPWADSMTYADMVNDVIRFLDHEGINRCHLIGHSMGGKTAMTVALKHPDRLERLVVADITPRAYQHGDSHRQYIDAMLDLNLSGGRSQAEIELSKAINEPRPVIQFLLQNLVFKDGQYRWRINLPVLARSLPVLMGDIDQDGLRTCEVPVLFLYGNNSNYVQAQDMELIRSLFSRASFQAVDNAGHWLHTEQPTAFISATRQFLSDQ